MGKEGARFLREGLKFGSEEDLNAFRILTWACQCSAQLVCLVFVMLIINTNDYKSVKIYKLVKILARGRLGVLNIVFQGKYFFFLS